MAQWDAEDDEEENEVGDEEKVGPRRSPYPLDRFINDFRTALEALYTAQAGSAETDETNNPRELLAARVAALKAFDPLRATIPSPDEAEEIADQRRRNIDPNRVIKRSPASRSAPSGDKRSSRPSFASGDGGGALASATVGSGDAVEGSEVGTQKRDKSKSIDDVLADPATEAEASGGGAPTAGEAAAAAATTPDIDLEVRAAAAQAAANGEDVETEEDAPPAPTEEEIVALAPVSPADFSQKIRQLGQLIATVERGDDAMWQIFLDPERGIEERRALATALAAAESPANQAYRLIRASAQFIGLKKLLHLGEVPQRNRRFTTLVSGFVNFAQTTHRTISSNDDQLVGLEPVLDHAAGTLIRLENLRINQFYAQQQPDHYNAEAVTAFRDEALAAVQALVDGKRLELVLTMAEEDTAAMIDLFSAESYVRELVANCRSYAEELQKGGHLASLEKLETAIGEAPIEFDRAEPAEPDPGPLPVQWTIGDELGPIFQRACNYLCEKAWAVLCERHEPKKVLPKLVDAARAAMSSCFVLQPERRRHAARPRMPITVASLAKLSGNADVHQLYVRVGTDGKVLYVEGYEDGTYADLMELREYSRVRMQTFNEGEVDSEPLQTGEKYLFTMGGTQDFFGASASAILAGCVRDDDGEIKNLPIFRPKLDH